MLTPVLYLTTANGKSPNPRALSPCSKVKTVFAIVVITVSGGAEMLLMMSPAKIDSLVHGYRHGQCYVTVGGGPKASLILTQDEVSHLLEY